jgi:N6-L-threonylcarbamoyladenine synthase
MKILSIETSCDDTCLAIIKVFEGKKISFEVIADIVSSQIKIHQKWGGVYPAVAKREHQRNLPITLIEALRESKLLKISKSKFLISKQILSSKLRDIEKVLKREENLFKSLVKLLKNYERPNIDLIAVTVGPGLEPCLWVGVNFARALAFYWKIPIVAVNHVEGHILVNWLDNDKKIELPVLSLVVSGGHTQLILIKEVGHYKILGETRDDAAGECFDKVAKILGLGYPGGPIVAAKAAARIKNPKSKMKINLPRPMIRQKNYDFSFSGLKTAVLYLAKQLITNNKQLTTDTKREICKETQQAIIDVLISKTLKAAREFKVKTIILGGGVSANKELRKQLKKEIINKIPNTRYFTPVTRYCTDNAVMGGVTAYFHYLKGEKMSWKEIRANANLRIGDDPIGQR